MALEFEGRKIESLHCEILRQDLAVTDDEGGQIQTGISKDAKLRDDLRDDLSKYIPEGCPLMMPKEARQLGNFAICTGCRYSIIQLEGGTRVVH